MATLLYVLAAGGAGLYALNAQDRARMESLEAERKRAAKPTPYQAPVTHISKVSQSQEYRSGRFQSAVPMVDERGARCWLVDFGDFSQTIMYHDPRLQLV